MALLTGVVGFVEPAGVPAEPDEDPEEPDEPPLEPLEPDPVSDDGADGSYEPVDGL